MDKMLCALLLSAGMLVGPVATQEAEPEQVRLSPPSLSRLGSMPLSPPRSITLKDLRVMKDQYGNEQCCPPGTILVGGQCILPHSNVCPEGTVQEGNVCVGKPLCPPKFHYDGQKCISDHPPRCQTGSRFNGKDCVSTGDPFCPEGSTFNGHSCVSTTPPTCPSGAQLKDNICVTKQSPTCPRGMQFDGEQGCVSTEPPSCPEGAQFSEGLCISVVPPSCERPFVLQGNTCIHSSKPECPTGATFDGTVCVSVTPPSCKTGVFDGGVCKDKQPPICPPRTTLKGSSCTVETGASCPAGQSLSIFQDQVRCCPDGFSWDGSFCVLKREATTALLAATSTVPNVFSRPPCSPSAPQGQPGMARTVSFQCHPDALPASRLSAGTV